MPGLRVGVASKPMKGFEVNGDAHLHLEAEGRSLVAVFDGLGHGADASVASERARRYVETHALDGLEELFHGCHAEIEDTRGVCMGVFRVDRGSGRIEYCGVGNTAAWILGEEHRRMVSVSGIVGYTMESLLRFEYRYDRETVLMLHTDGVSSRFSLPSLGAVRDDPQRAAEEILEGWGKETDDATVVIAVERR
ncbi:MAG: SpoIIE family protein phosphatase [Candidatus Bathyarchaeota archaeon]